MNENTVLRIGRVLSIIICIILLASSIKLANNRFTSVQAEVTKEENKEFQEEPESIVEMINSLSDEDVVVLAFITSILVSILIGLIYYNVN